MATQKLPACQELRMREREPRRRVTLMIRYFIAIDLKAFEKQSSAERDSCSASAL